MRRKRIRHHVDIFCEMCAGWRLVNDIETLIEWKQGNLKLDVLNKSVQLNGIFVDKEFHMLYEISDWFDKELSDNNIDKALIKDAFLIVDFIITIIDGKPKSRTKKIIEINLKLTGKVLTDEEEYLANKNKTMEYHYVEKK